MNKKAMTNREFYQAVINANLSDEMTAKAKALIATLDKKSEKASEARTENRKANLEIAAQIAEKMGDRTLAASEIAVLMSDTGMSKEKVSAVCRMGVDAGIFTSIDDYKVGGKGRKVKGYTPVK